MAAVGFPLFTSLMNFLSSCLQNVFWDISNIFNIVCWLFLYLHSLTLLDISSVTWMLLPWIMEFFRCERYHSFCTLSIPAFLRTSSLSLNSSKQTKTGLGNKKHENWMTRKMNVRKLELYLKEQWFYCWNKMYCTVNWFERGIFFVSQHFLCDVIKGGGLFTMLSITFTAVCQPAPTYSCLAAKVALSTRMQYSASLF